MGKGLVQFKPIKLSNNIKEARSVLSSSINRTRMIFRILLPPMGRIVPSFLWSPRKTLLNQFSKLFNQLGDYL